MNTASFQAHFKEDGLYISIPDQRLYLVKNLKIEQIYPISTSKNAPSCIANSFGTPWGRHEIAEKIGESIPLGTVFKSRQSTGKLFQDYPLEAGLITSRILWLKGLEEGVNRGQTQEGLCCDTYARYIYIHGTSKEDQIGTPFSQGCINMKNQDVIDLFERAGVGDSVFIYKDQSLA